MRYINKQNPESDTADILRFGEDLLNRFLQITYVKNNTALNREVGYIINRLRDESFKVAVIGEFSSGKSTFLNALIGKDILTHGVKETTAAVTMLVNTHNGQQEVGRYTLSDGDIKPINDYSQLRDLTTIHSTTYQVSNQIESVELFVPFMDTEIPISFVDTPGLNGVAAMHRERTISIIQSSHACIYMLQSRGIGGTDREALQWIGQHHQDLIFIQNFIDDINMAEGETLEDILNKQKEILSEKVFVGRDDVYYSVCGISAMKALAGKDTDIERLHSTDTFPLSQLDRERLYRESNFDEALSCIHQFMESSFQRSRYAALRAAYKLIEQTAQIIGSLFEVQNALRIKTNDAKIAIRTQQLLDNWESRRIEHEKKLDNFIVSRMNEGRRLLMGELKRRLEAFKDNIPLVYSQIETPDEWDTFNKDKIMELAVADSSTKIRNQLRDLLSKYCENTHNLAVLRIQEYAGLTDEFSDETLPCFQVALDDSGFQMFFREEDNIRKEESLLYELKVNKKKAEEKKVRLLEEAQRFSEMLNQTELKQNHAKENYDNKKRKLGAMPSASLYYVEETKFEERGGLGILDLLLGPQKVTYQVEKQDFSAQNKWKEDERQIQNEYQRQMSEISTQLNFLEQELQRIKEDIAEVEKTVGSETLRIERHTILVQEAINGLYLKRTLAAKEYLQRQKEKLKNNVYDYLDTTLQQSLTDIINQEITQTKEKLSHDVRESFITVSNSQKEYLQQMLNDKLSNGGVLVEQLKQDAKDVLKIKNSLEDYLCKIQMRFN